MGIAELAQALDMSRPTTHRYASTLVALDYLEQGPRRKYRLGLRAGDPGRTAVSSTTIGGLPRGCLTSLRDRSGCTAGTGILDGASVVYVDRARSSLPGHSEIQARLGRGSRVPAANTAMGRAILAHLEESDRQAAVAVAIPEQSEERSRAARKLMKELERTAARGFALADQVHVKGQRCLAAPLRSRTGSVVGAVEIAAAKSAHTQAETIERFAPLVMASAEEISALLGFGEER